ncbi:MAG: hypothetical protein IV100_12280 [Myxococcales bacterium]|nr:hypothetical protein [Myxococcales bacterium]
MDAWPGKWAWKRWLSRALPAAWLVLGVLDAFALDHWIPKVPPTIAALGGVAAWLERRRLLENLRIGFLVLIPLLLLLLFPLLDPEGAGWIASRVEPMTIPLTFIILFALAVQFDRMLVSGCGRAAQADDETRDTRD